MSFLLQQDGGATPYPVIIDL